MQRTHRTAPPSKCRFVLALVLPGLSLRQIYREIQQLERSVVVKFFDDGIRH